MNKEHVEVTLHMLLVDFQQATAGCGRAMIVCTESVYTVTVS